MTALTRFDPEVAAAILAEARRQDDGLEMIASENYVSEAVLEAVGSVLTNKYAEGLPRKRYYGGCEHVDVVEELAIGRAKRLFGAASVNVQPHSGSQANMAVYLSALKPGDTLLGMDLSHGGHLTHGSPVNFSGQLFRVVSYGVDPVHHRIDFDRVRALAHEHRPKMIVTGASAYSRAIPFDRFREIADEVGALLLADIAHVAGLVVAKLHPDPVPVCHFVTTTTHKTLRGPRGGMVMADAEHGDRVDKEVFPGIQGGPLEHVIAGKAVAFLEALDPSFAVYAARIVENARALAETLMGQGLTLVSGGTDNHLLLLDLTSTGVTGKAAERALGRAGITVNKNTVPGETRSPFVTSGVRVGTPALTTRGMGPGEMRWIGDRIAAVVRAPDDAALTDRIREEVRDLCASFPIYAGTRAALAADLEQVAAD